MGTFGVKRASDEKFCPSTLQTSLYISSSAVRLKVKPPNSLVAEKYLHATGDYAFQGFSTAIPVSSYTSQIQYDGCTPAGH